MAAFDLIPEAQTACAPPRPFSTKRVEGFAPNPRDPRTPYALFADVVVATRLGLSTAASLATETAGFDGPGGYYSRSIASSPHCIYFSSKRGLEWARDVDGKMEGGILVPRREAEILGVATGLAPRADAGMPRASVYFTVFDERAKRGGVYYVDEPTQCVNQDFVVGGYLTGNGSGAFRLMLNEMGPFDVNVHGQAGYFVLPKGLADGTEYILKVVSPNECQVVSGGTGRIQGAHVHSVHIECLYAG